MVAGVVTTNILDKNTAKLVLYRCTRRKRHCHRSTTGKNLPLLLGFAPLDKTRRNLSTWFGHDAAIHGTRTFPPKLPTQTGSGGIIIGLPSLHREDFGGLYHNHPTASNEMSHGVVFLNSGCAHLNPRDRLGTNAGDHSGTNGIFSKPLADHGTLRQRCRVRCFVNFRILSGYNIQIYVSNGIRKVQLYDFVFDSSFASWYIWFSSGEYWTY